MSTNPNETTTETKKVEQIVDLRRWHKLTSISIPYSVGKARQGLPNPGYSAGFGNPAGSNPRQVGHTQISDLFYEDYF